MCNRFETELKYLCERFSNNNKTEFTGQEAVTIYLNNRKPLRNKNMDEFASEHLCDWFPKLHSYEALNFGINRLSEVFRVLSESILNDTLRMISNNQID